MICDEAHRSIYNKYKDIFNYFDAPLIGLTATPKDEIDKNTYTIFELENGVPTYGYDLEQAVKDRYLVDYISVESKFKFIEQGIVYDDLSEEDKVLYEETFEDENGDLPDAISPSAVNTWIFNEDTIKKVLNIYSGNNQFYFRNKHKMDKEKIMSLLDKRKNIKIDDIKKFTER